MATDKFMSNGFSGKGTACTKEMCGGPTREVIYERTSQDSEILEKDMSYCRSVIQNWRPFLEVAIRGNLRIFVVSKRKRCFSGDIVQSNISGLLHA
jgi:hypothetical protein